MHYSKCKLLPLALHSCLPHCPFRLPTSLPPFTRSLDSMTAISSRNTLIWPHAPPHVSGNPPPTPLPPPTPRSPPLPPATNLPNGQMVSLQRGIEVRQIRSHCMKRRFSTPHSPSWGPTGPLSLVYFSSYLSCLIQPKQVSREIVVLPSPLPANLLHRAVPVLPPPPTPIPRLSLPLPPHLCRSPPPLVPPSLTCLHSPSFAVQFKLQPLELIDTQCFKGMPDQGGPRQPLQSTAHMIHYTPDISERNAKGHWFLANVIVDIHTRG